MHGNVLIPQAPRGVMASQRDSWRRKLNLCSRLVKQMLRKGDDTQLDQRRQRCRDICLDFIYLSERWCPGSSRLLKVSQLYIVRNYGNSFPCICEERGKIGWKQKLRVMPRIDLWSVRKDAEYPWL